ncbi:MAG: hypothetical protein A2Z99_08155 [Treponema sp. GWB1_62_6]|nr:MAG: hypothetical protein A2Z99_08155 [Treponema sp. GWB1_62_6]
MLVPSDMILQAGAIVAPLMVTGLVAWNHLAGKVSRVEEQVRTQNGRLVKLEDGVVYRDTCAAVHTAASEAYLRIEERMEEDRADRRNTAEQIMRLREEMAARTGEIARLLEETRAQRRARGLPADYPSGEDDAE